MPSFDDLTNMTTVAAALYFLGVYFHYVHVKTIFHLLDRYEELNTTKLLVTKNRPVGPTGYAGQLKFNTNTFTLEEKYAFI